MQTVIDRPAQTGGIERATGNSIHLTIESDIRIPAHSMPPVLLDAIVRDLTLDNPAYLSAARMGRWTGDIPQHLTLWELDGETLTLPRGYGQTLLKRCREHGVTWATDDRRVTLPSVAFASRIRLRPEQEPAVERLLRMWQGGLVAPCGSGKTMMALEIIAEARQPALVLVHTRELAAQWRERAAQFLAIAPDEIGVLGDGQRRIGERLTIGLVQTLAKCERTAIAGRFGLVLLDEAHHAPASTFRQVFGAWPAHYRLWLSATPERADGLHPVLYAVGGPVLHTIDRANLQTVTPALHVIETEFAGMDEDYSTLLTRLTQDERRNRRIVDTLAAHAPGHDSLVLSERIEHLETLRRMLADAAPELHTALLTGQLPKRERNDVMTRVRTREVDVLFATQLAREGLDIAHLDQLFLTCPKKAAAAVEQECGRIMRPAEGKTGAAVWDFWDAGTPMLRKQWWARRDVYRKLGMEIPAIRREVSV